MVVVHAEETPESFITYITIWIAGLGTFFERHLMHFESVSTRTCVLYEIMIDYEYRAQLGMDRERERDTIRYGQSSIERAVGLPSLQKR